MFARLMRCRVSRVARPARPRLSTNTDAECRDESNFRAQVGQLDPRCSAEMGLEASRHARQSCEEMMRAICSGDDPVVAIAATQHNGVVHLVLPWNAKLDLATDPRVQPLCCAICIS